jgi:hypothetical protein
MTATPSAGASSTTKSLEEVLDDLCARFIINLPNEELESFDRLCFQIEAAHWFYLDFFREEFPSLPVFNLKEFVRQSIFTSTDFRSLLISFIILTFPPLIL